MATIRDLLDHLQVEYEANGAAVAKTFPRHRRRLDEDLGACEAAALGHAEIHEFKAKLTRAGLSKKYVNNLLTYLRRAYKLAVEDRLIARDDVPAIRLIRMSRNENARRGFVPPDKIPMLLYYLQGDPNVADVVEFGLFSGWRIGEILGLEWRSVGDERIELPGSQEKTGCGRSIPMVGRIQRVIQRRRLAAIPGLDLVFHRRGKRIKSFDTRWRTACERAGLAGVVPYAVRHSFVRLAMQSGVDREVVKRFTGHRTDDSFSRYNVTNDDDMRDALLIADEHAQRAAQSRPDSGAFEAYN